MALLTPEDLENLLDKLEYNEKVITNVTGSGIKQICEETYNTFPGSEVVGIVPVTSGNGIIDNFTASLAAIVNHFGLKGFVTEHTDISGYHEAVSRRADIVMMADDHIFIAHNLKNGKISTNHECTGIIYSEIAARYLHADSTDILVIGLGRVGYAGASHLAKKGFNVYACDPNWEFLEKAVKELGVKPYERNSGKKFSMIMEATPCKDTISEGMVSDRCLVSTPGIPCGLPGNIGKKYKVDMVMEPLVIGVASMLYSVFDETAKFNGLRENIK